jgi:hypothetical protein
MIKGDYDKLTNLATYNVCSEHHTPLEVAWYGPDKTWVLRCGHDHYPDAITRQLSLTEMHKAGEPLPGHIEDKIEKRQRRKAMEQGKKTTKETLPGMPNTDLGTGELLLPEMATALIDYARKYELDPVRGHVVLMYGKPYITIDGYLWHANRTGKFYTLSSHPMTEDEKHNHMVNPLDHAWLAMIIFTGTDQSFGGIGIVTQEEMIAKSPRDQSKLRSPVVAAHPWQLAQKRAEWQALRRAFPIGESQEATNEARD